MLPKVSVIIPAFNKDYLTMKCVESVINQTYDNIEIIVIDDGSKDQTYNLIKKYIDKIIYVKQENKGACAARNYGIKISSGKYIALLDCDDIYYPTKIERSVELLESHEENRFLITKVNLIDMNNNIVNKNIKICNIDNKNFYKDLICFNINITNSTLVASKKSLEKVGLFDESIFISADRDLLIKLSKIYKVIYLNESLTGYRVINETIYNDLSKAIEEFEYIIEKNILNDLKLKNYALQNLYFIYSKFYAAQSNINKSKKLLLKIIRINFFYRKIIKVLIMYFYAIVFPNSYNKLFYKYRKYD